NATIGYGELIHYGPVTEKDRERFNPGWTEKVAQSALKEKTAEFDSMVNNRAKYRNLNLSQEQFDALSVLTYNCPKGGLSVMNDIKAGKSTEEIKKTWLSYNTQDGNVVKGLTNRRNAEWILFSTGKYKKIIK
ncbi:MAG TPA: hypothetical protein DC049_18110, partial [Spirochaetia bacterium]|nr:hypothetical protein [Spirochaetia bacterium]